MTYRVFRLHLAAALALACLAGCGGGGGGGGGGSAQTPTSPQPPADTTAPNAPERLTATAPDWNRVELSWGAASDASGVVSYRIYRDESAEPLASVTVTSYSDRSVVASTPYRYTVRAVDAAGNISTASNAVTVTTPAAGEPQISGLDSRPINTSCRAWPRPTANAQLTLERYTSLNFNSPIAMLQAPSDAARWFIVEQRGRVMQFNATTPTSASTFLNIESRVRFGGEMGLLGMAFHPNYPTDPRVFVSYTTGTPLISRISAFTTADGGATLNAASEQVLLTLEQPDDNHNGGHLAFGRDGYLYIGFGDGGGSGDPHGASGNGQRLTTMLGKMLRIDINGAAPYAIPASNPFAQNARCPPGGRANNACPEIYAWGFRNPWRWSFDRDGGDLWVADVGQSAYEEVNRVVLGGNYGWKCREGAHTFDNSIASCATSSLIDPITEYGRSLGASITGGYVYRGTQSTDLFGRYLFADFVSGRIFGWIAEGATAREPRMLLDTSYNISAFGESNSGELYVVDYGGSLHHIVFASSTANDTAPTQLSATGCVLAFAPTQPAAGLIPYTVNAPFWSDGADKDRWLALPEGQTIALQSDGDWELPTGTVLMKHFRSASRLIETRLLMRHPDGAWGGFSYEWNAAQTDATLLRGGAQRAIGLAEPWVFPSESQCLECHTSVAGRTLGLETAQLNGTHHYPTTARMANQLYTLNHIGALTPPIANPATRPALVNPADANATLDARARAYLQTNCAFCHRPSGPTPSTMDLRATTALSAMNACAVSPKSGDLGLGAAAHLIAPGNAAASVIVNRMNRRDIHAMPPIGSNQVDAAGVALISAWIDQLNGCE